MTNVELSNLEQGSPEWRQAKVGIPSASRFAELIARFKSAAKNKTGEEPAERKNYRMELICEILTGQPYPRFVSKEMEWGTATEPFARAAYEMKFDVLVETCGFIMHPYVPRFGASPDGLVGKDGMIQIKCPATRTHLEWMMARTSDGKGVIPEEHRAQMFAEMACTGRQWSELVSFDPRLPAHLQLWVSPRLPRFEHLIAGFDEEVQHFNDLLDSELAALPQGPPQAIAALLEMPRVDELEF
jgi:hypothetical protein